MNLFELYNNVRKKTSLIVNSLSPEDCQVQSMPDASPVKWHLAHTNWFWETFILAPRSVGQTNSEYQFLFNSYYESLGHRHARPQRGLITRPDLTEILAWRDCTDAAMEALLNGLSAEDPALQALFELGIAHEQQHQELILMDVKHLLASHPFPTGRYGQQANSKHQISPLKANTSFEGGLIEIGHSGAGFAFDNEGPRHKVWLNPFALANHTVTNADWKAFIADAGYSTPSLWLSDGWSWRQSAGTKAPLYWQDGDETTITLSGVQPIEDGEPVCHISFYEAAAFAEWAGGRLPTEAEWELAASGLPVEGNFANGATAAHPAPISHGHGVQGLFGNVWEWTRSDYSPYPGFKPAAGAVGEYNGKFMSGQIVLRGGSCATPMNHVRATYRNFFPPTARWVFSGLRLAWDA